MSHAHNRLLSYRELGAVVRVETQNNDTILKPPLIHLNAQVTWVFSSRFEFHHESATSYFTSYQLQTRLGSATSLYYSGDQKSHIIA